MAERIVTTAPIDIEILKEVFKDPTSKEIVIDLGESKLPANVMLAYITNLGLRPELHFDSMETYLTYLKEYMSSSMFHELPQLEVGALDLLLQYKDHPTESGGDFSPLIEDEGFQPILTKWVNVTESLSLYVLKWITTDEMAVNYYQEFPKDEEKDLTGLNFVNLIKYELFSLVMEQGNASKLKYYPHLFEEAVYQGRNLWHFWADERNPVYLVTVGMMEGLLSEEGFAEAAAQSTEQIRKAIDDVSSL